MGELLKTRLVVFRELATHRVMYLVGIVGLVVALVGMNWDSPTAMLTGAAGLILGLVGVVLDGVTFRRALADVDVGRDPAETWRSLSPPATCRCYLRLEGFEDVFLLAPLRATLVAEPHTGHTWHPDPPVEILDGTWHVARAWGPTPLQAYAVLRERMRKGKILTNDAKVRILSELGLLGRDDSDTIRIQRTSYFNGVLTNDLATQVIREGGSVAWRGINSCLDDSSLEGPQLADLGKSRASNHLGVSALVITSDWVVVLLLQGRRSNRGSRQLVATGSGSMDWTEAREGAGFVSLAYSSAVRELREEFTQQLGPVSSAELLGLARCLSRGGKPEISFLLRLSDTWAELESRVMSKGQPRIRRAERHFITNFQHWDLGSADTARERLSTLRESNRAVISSSLDFSLLCLMRTLEA